VTRAGLDELPPLPPEAARAARDIHAALAGLRAIQRHALDQGRDVLDLPAAATTAALAIIAGELTDPDTTARVLEGIRNLLVRLRWERMKAFCRNRGDATAA
jgi:hypothetical protein